MDMAIQEAAAPKLEPIPQPPRSRFTGNLAQLKLADTPMEAMMKVAEEFGPIFRLEVGGNTTIIVSNFDLANELFDTRRFDKGIGPGLKQVRNFNSEGLFSSFTHEAHWRKAHNILLPNFSHAAMKRYAPGMLRIANELIAKWDKACDAGEPVDVAADMTRLTLDTIGLCGFGHEFDSFKRDEPHPFINAMMGFLNAMQDNARRPAMVNKMLVLKQRQLRKDSQFINDYVDKIVSERKKDPHPERYVDLLSYMLTGVDRESGEKLEDSVIRANIVTFLIAGHETTSGLLSFALYELLHHPKVLARAQEEVDRVLSDQPDFNQIHQLEYILQILKETLRHWPTAPFFSLAPMQDTVIGGRYLIPAGQPCQVLLKRFQQDPKIWGPNAAAFDPDQFAPEKEENRPANAFKAFGNGQRACIGRQFALQEAMLVLGMVLQRYEPVDFDNYQMHLKQSLTIKPGDFHIKLKRREAPKNQVQVTKSAEPARTDAARLSVKAHNTPLLVLYGSNMGSAEAFAHLICDDGSDRGFKASIAPLDDFAGQLPREGVVLIVSATYNGTPPDNAAKFVHWLSETRDSLQGVKYAVMGCGNRDWAASFQAVPKLIDTRMAELGAERLIERGEADARGDFDGQFQKWYKPVWELLGEKLGLGEAAAPVESRGDQYEVEFLEDQRDNPFVASFGARPMTVVENHELYHSERSARHIELVLPEGVTYQPGDHLGVIPRNDPALVTRVAERFRLDPKSRLRLKQKAGSRSVLPVDRVISLSYLLTEYVELQDVVTRRQLETMAAHTDCPPHQKELARLASDDGAYKSEIMDQCVSLLDILEDFPSCELPFNLFLEMLPPLRPRYYSISSSPSVGDRILSVTVGVLDAPARCGTGRFRGACSNYLARSVKGQQVYAFVRSNPAFHLPQSPATPLLMVGPGTGLAAFRGFLQERGVQHGQGQKLGPAMLFYGCRSAEEDFLYQEELEEYAREGIVELVVAFSRQDPARKVYVQHKMLENRERIWELLEQGAVIYICGDAGKMAPDVRAELMAIYRAKTDKSEFDAEAWMQDLAVNNRLRLDVWASN